MHSQGKILQRNTIIIIRVGKSVLGLEELSRHTLMTICWNVIYGICSCVTSSTIEAYARTDKEYGPVRDCSGDVAD